MSVLVASLSEMSFSYSSDNASACSGVNPASVKRLMKRWVSNAMALLMRGVGWYTQGRSKA